MTTASRSLELQQLRWAVLATGEIFGGAERQILTLLGAVRAQLRDAPELLILHDRELGARARDMGVRVHALGAERLIDTSSRRRLSQALAAGRFDIINVHGYRATAYLALVSRGRSRIIKTDHGSVEAGAGDLRNRAKAACYRWLETRAAHRIAATMVYVTRDLQAMNASNNAGLRQTVIYNGILPPDRTTTKAPAEYAAHPLNLVVAGRLETIKGVDIAIRAMADAELPTGTHLHVIGWGPADHDLQRLAQEIAVTPRVSFHGFRDNAYDYIAHADIVLMPSRHEGLPYTLLEALALGTPVIGSRVGGLAEVLSSEHNAVLVPAENAAALAAAVRRVCREPAFRRSLVQQGQRLVAEQFTAQGMASRYLALAADLTSDRPR